MVLAGSDGGNIERGCRTGVGRCPFVDVTILLTLLNLWGYSRCFESPVIHDGQGVDQTKKGRVVGTASLFARSLAAVCLYRQDLVLGRFNVSRWTEEGSLRWQEWQEWHDTFFREWRIKRICLVPHRHERARKRELWSLLEADGSK